MNCWKPVLFLILVSGLSLRADSPAWVNVTNDLGGDAATWGRFSAMTLGAAPGADTVYVHVGSVGLFATKDGGAHWTNTQVPPGPCPMDGFVSNFVFDPKDPKTFWMGCWYGKGLFKTTDGGATFQQLGTMDRGEGVSVDFTDPERKTIALGQHEQLQGLFLSKDGGATWKKIGANLPPGTNFPSWPLLLSSNVLLVNTSGYHKDLISGLWRSEDAGETWAKVSDFFATGTPTLTSKGTVFYPIKEGLARSTDGGKTWTLLKAPVAGTIIELPDGRLAGKWYTAAGFIKISSDNGDTWQDYGPKLPVNPTPLGPGIVYLPGTKAFMISTPGKDKKIPDAVWRLDALQ